VAFTGFLTLSMALLGAASDNGGHGHHGKSRTNYVSTR
jgi:hypothetical protein